MKSLLSRVNKIKRQDLPLVITSKIVAFPHTSANIVIEDEASLKAIEASVYNGRYFFIGYPLQEDYDVDVAKFSADRLYNVGIIAYGLQILKMPDKKVHLFLEGRERAFIKNLAVKDGYLQANLEPLNVEVLITSHIVALMRNIEVLFEQLARYKKLKKDSARSIMKTESPHKIVDLIAPYLETHYKNKIEKFLLNRDISERLQSLAEEIRLEIDIFEIKDDIEKKVNSVLAKNQKEYFLNEQMKEIQRRLNKDGEEGGLFEKIKSRGFPRDIYDKVVKEYKKLESLPLNSPESGILKGYIEWMLDLPWKEYTEDHFNFEYAKRSLELSHFGMKEAKEHILEFLSVRSISKNSRQPIICLVGPPGTGKTSLSQGIAKSLGRKFVQVSLGGLRDEAEIRGHRRTYVGAMPGKIIQAMKNAKVTNPVFLLDEIEKLSSDYRGDPASALLEVLDPEQNNRFVDHYIDVPYDLSNILFITTANSLDPIPLPLLDRMEIIQIEGYTYWEKLAIARDFFLDRLLSENGLQGLKIEFSEEAILKIIHDYTIESGVRSLYRVMTKVLRKFVKRILEKDPELLNQRYHYPSSYYHRSIAGTVPLKDKGIFYYLIKEEDIISYLGPKVPRAFITSKQAGLVYGLAWTSSGGKVLAIESLCFEGKGELIVTGSLGNVMKESARIAYSLAKRIAVQIDPNVNLKVDLHLHCPEGATPKDGPSAGITMAVSMISALLEEPIRLDTAMTGELSLVGNVLPIGGLHEKVLAAHRLGISRVILPKENESELIRLPKDIIKTMEVHFVKDVEEVWNLMYRLQPENSLSLKRGEVDSSIFS